MSEIKTTTSTLPKVSELFKESFETFKSSIFHLFVISLINWFSFIILLIISLIALFLVLGTKILTSLLAHHFNLSNFGSLLTPGYIWFFIIFIIFLVFVSILLTSLFSGALMFVIDSQGKMPIGQSLSKGKSKMFSLFLVNLMTTFLVIGGISYIWLLCIPGILISLFLQFAQYETVIGTRSGIHSLKRSAFIVKNHFFEIFGRVFLIGIIIFCINIVFSIAFNTYGSTNIGVNMSVFGMQAIVRPIFQLVAGWFTIVYLLTLYKQAVNTVDEHGEVSTLWMWIVSIIGWILMVITIVIIAIGISTLIKSNVLKNMHSQQAVEQSPQVIAKNVLDKANLYRQNQNLTLLQVDPILCNYAQRRLLQINQNGGFDSHEGFSSDLQNASVSKVYFSNYQSVNELYDTTSASENAGTFVDSIVKTPKNNIANPIYTNACVQADKNYLVFIFGQKAQSTYIQPTIVQETTFVTPTPYVYPTYVYPTIPPGQPGSAQWEQQFQAQYNQIKQEQQSSQ